MWWQFRATVMTLWRWTKWKSKQLLQVSCGAGLHKELLTELEIASANLNRKLYDANWPRDFACVVLLVVADHCMSSLFSSLQEQGLPPLPIPPNPSFSSSFEAKYCCFFQMHWITILGRLFAFSKFVQYLRIFRPLKEYDSYMNSTFVLLATFLEGSQAKKKISVSSKAKLSGPFLAIQHFSQIKQVVNPTPRISLFVRPLVHPEKIPHHGYMHQGQGSWI